MSGDVRFHPAPDRATGWTRPARCTALPVTPPRREDPEPPCPPSPVASPSSRPWNAARRAPPSPAPCTAANVSYVLASGVVADFFGVEFELGRKAITEKQWHFQVPKDQRCNAE